MPYAIPAWNAMTGLLPHAGALPIIGAINPLVLGVGTVTLLLLTEKDSPDASTHWQALVMRMNQLAIPMFIGFLVAGCPGMVVAVGISRLYKAYKIRPEPQESVPTPSLTESPVLTTLMTLQKWSVDVGAMLHLHDWKMPPQTEQELQQLLDIKDPTLRLQTASRLLMQIPERHTGLYSIVLSTAFNAMFNTKFNGNDIAKLSDPIAAFIASYSGTPPRMEDLFYFVCQLGGITKITTSGNTDDLAAINRCIKALVGYIEQQLDAHKELTADQLLQLSHIYSENSLHLKHKNKNSLRDALLRMLPSTTTPDMTPTTRFKMIQAFTLLGDRASAQNLLATHVSAPLDPEKTPPTSFEELALLVRNGYHQGLEQAQIKTWLQTIADQQKEGNIRLIEGLLLFQEQLASATNATDGYEHIIDIFNNPSGSQKPFTFDELLSAYNLCRLSPYSASTLPKKKLLLETIQRKIQKQLILELNRAKRGEGNGAKEMAIRIIAAADITMEQDGSFAMKIAEQYSQAAKQETRIIQTIQSANEAKALEEQEYQQHLRQGGCITAWACLSLVV